MPWLVLKIERPRWLQRRITQDQDASAEAIVSLRVKGNCLSVWEIPHENDLPEVALALCTSWQHIDAIDLVVLEKSAVEDRGLVLRETPGNTKYPAMAGAHRDIVDLDFWGIGNVMECTQRGFKEHRVYRLTVSRLMEIIKVAIRSGALEIGDLHERVQDKLRDR